MKTIVSIAALLMGTAVAANADPGIVLKNCITETTINTVLANTRWMAELVEEDPSARYLFASGLLEGLNMMTEDEWTELSGEDLSSLRYEPASTLFERWLYDAMADCNQVTQ